MMSNHPISHDLLPVATRYIEALEAGVPSAELAAFFCDNATLKEHPSAFRPRALVRQLDAILGDYENRKDSWWWQRYSITRSMVFDKQVLLEVKWEGVVAKPMPSLKVGDVVRASFGVVLLFEGERILAEQLYSGIEPYAQALARVMSGE